MHSAPWPARESTVPQSPEKHGRDRFPSSSCLLHSFYDALLLIPAVEVSAAGREGVVQHKVGHAAGFAHRVVQVAQGGGQIVQPQLFHHHTDTAFGEASLVAAAV